MSLRWMPAMANVPPRSSAASAGGTRVPTGAKRMAESSGSGRRCVGGPGTRGPELQRQRLRLGRPGHHMDAGAMGQCDLRRDVRGAPEPVDPEPATFGEVGPPEGPVADDPGAQQRCDLLVAEPLGQGVGVRLLDDRVLRIPAVDVPAGEARGEAQVLAAGDAEPARAAGVGQPGHPDAIALAPAGGAGPEPVDDADHLVPRRHASVTRREVPFGQVEVRPADAAHARTRTRTCPGPGSGTGLSTRSSGPRSTGPARSTTHAFIRSGIGVSVRTRPRPCQWTFGPTDRNATLVALTVQRRAAGSIGSVHGPGGVSDGSLLTRRSSARRHAMTLTSDRHATATESQPEKGTAAPYVAPGRPGSLVDVKARYENFIGGSWVPPVKGGYMANVSPVNGKPFCEVARSTAEDVELALDAAHAAKEAWGETSLTERAAVLNRIADAIDANREMLAVAETWENGKPVRETLAADIPLAADHFRYFASETRSLEGRTTEIDKDTVAYHFHEPLGVVGQIIPFNFPLLMAAWKIAPALAAGNCTVVKPASPTPWSILKLAEIISDLVPPGVINIVTGPGGEIGKALASSPADRQDRLHRRDHHWAADHAVRRAEPDPLDGGARRQVSEHLLCRCHGRGRRVPGQGHRGSGALRLQQGRGVHLPLTRPHPGVDLRPFHGALPRADRTHPSGRSPRSRHDGRCAELGSADGEDRLLRGHRSPGGCAVPHRRRTRPGR